MLPAGVIHWRVWVTAVWRLWGEWEKNYRDFSASGWGEVLCIRAGCPCTGCAKWLKKKKSLSSWATSLKCPQAGVVLRDLFVYMHIADRTVVTCLPLSAGSE